jgi:hypothetical protein
MSLIHYAIISALAGLASSSETNDAILDPTVIAASGGLAYTLYPLLFSDLATLTSTTIISTVVTETLSGQTTMPSIQVTVQPGGYRWRTD